MKTYFNDHPIRSAGAKSPNQLFASSSLRSQVVNTSMSPETIDVLQDWQNAFSPAPQNNVTVPRIEAIVMNEEQSNFVNSILGNQESQPKLKCVEIRAHLWEMI